ncbi:MAG: hypothetical protein ACOCUV_02250 [bacterium]
MENQIHPHYIKSSNLIFGTVGLGLINFFFADELLSAGQNTATAILTLIIIIGIATIVRQGKEWVKYLLLVFTLFGLISIPFIINIIVQVPVVGIVNIAQTIMQLWATVLLFKIPKTVDENKKAE